MPTEMHLNQPCDSCVYTHAMNIKAASDAAEERMKKGAVDGGEMQC